ncbi:MAG TPA: hypothetical protein VNV85_16855 [Puia sp.]|jgi:hypothetical protein|nr:hypothetical protein [Puia sp.]
MTHPNLLKRLEYCIPGSNTRANDRSNKRRRSLAMHVPLVKVNIDFVKKNLSLEGNSLVMVTPVGNSELTISACDNKRIKVKASFYSSFNIDLSDLSNDGLVFPLQGIIEDDKGINSCSGLLALDCASTNNWPRGNEWQLTIYFYDDFNDEREIKLKLTMYSFSENTLLN